jgi:hypothetical protein
LSHPVLLSTPFHRISSIVLHAAEQGLRKNQEKSLSPQALAKHPHSRIRYTTQGVSQWRNVTREERRTRIHQQPDCMENCHFEMRPLLRIPWCLKCQIILSLSRSQFAYKLTTWQLSFLPDAALSSAKTSRCKCKINVLNLGILSITMLRVLSYKEKQPGFQPLHAKLSRLWRSAGYWPIKLLSQPCPVHRTHQTAVSPGYEVFAMFVHIGWAVPLGDQTKGIRSVHDG